MNHLHDACVGTRSNLGSLDGLREHLQWAIELEHSTIPPYMCALYSLDPTGNREAAEVMRSILLEEMLHLVLVGNILNAVGGRPRLDTPRMLPGYPRCLPHSDHSFDLELMPFSPQGLDLFLKLEQTSRPDSAPESDHYETIGQFYSALEQGLRDLCAAAGEAAVFCGDRSRQITSDMYGGAGGRIIVVDGLTSALAALDEVVEQGEGRLLVGVGDQRGGERKADLVGADRHAPSRRAHSHRPRSGDPAAHRAHPGGDASPAATRFR